MFLCLINLRREKKKAAEGTIVYSDCNVSDNRNFVYYFPVTACPQDMNPMKLHVELQSDQDANENYFRFSIFLQYSRFTLFSLFIQLRLELIAV